MLKKENFKLILNREEAIFFPIFYGAFGAGHFFFRNLFLYVIN